MIKTSELPALSVRTLKRFCQESETKWFDLIRWGVPYEKLMALTPDRTKKRKARETAFMLAREGKVKELRRMLKSSNPDVRKEAESEWVSYWYSRGHQSRDKHYYEKMAEKFPAIHALHVLCKKAWTIFDVHYPYTARAYPDHPGLLCFTDDGFGQGYAKVHWRDGKPLIELLPLRRTDPASKVIKGDGDSPTDLYEFFFLRGLRVGKPVEIEKFTPILDAYCEANRIPGTEKSRKSSGSNPLRPACRQRAWSRLLRGLR